MGGYDDVYGQIQNADSKDWSDQRTRSLLNQYEIDFSQQFQNATGRPPTADEINQFYSQAVAPVIGTSAGFSGTDPNAIAQQYIPQAFQQQIQQNQAAQLPKLETQISDLASGIGAKTAAQFSDPNNPIYQAFSGGANNLGISPSSGAFQAGIGSTIGNAENSTIQSLLSSLGGASIGGNQPQTLQGLQGQGQTAADSMMTRNNNLSDFNLQADLAKQLSDMGQPSGVQNALGMASSSAQGVGGLLQGGAAAKNATSYVCKELIKRGLLCESDMDDFHIHIMPAMFKKGRAFWKYAMDAWKLVDAANKVGIDWSIYKPLLFDRVMDEPNACNAVDLYADACRQLCMESDPTLWDERVMRTSWMDSLPFIPLLLGYEPFREAVGKCIRIKTLIIYDKPRCQVHR